MILEAWIAISSPSLQIGAPGLGSVPPFLLLGPGPLSALLFKAPLPAPFPGSGGHFQTPMAFRARLGPGATRCAPGSQIGGRQRRNEEEVGVSELAGQGRGGLGGLNRIRSV